MIDIKKPIFAIGIREALMELQTSRLGLSSFEAKKRRGQFGVNQIPEEKKYSRLKLYISQFGDSLTLILLLAIIVSLVFRNYTDAGFIILVVFISTTLGFVQEDKVAKALILLKKVVQVYVRVMRDGQETLLKSIELVPGDIVILQSGDKVSGDCRLIEAKELEVSESTLTGESYPIRKILKELPDAKTIAEKINMLFAGTLVEKGRAVAVVMSTGDDTEFGKIAKTLKETEETPAPLQIKISRLTRLLGKLILAFTAFLLIFGTILGRPLSEIFESSLAFAVSAIPAGLPPLITVILVLGMRRLLKHNTLVKRLDVVEILGSTTVICTDKTGTLTSGNMQISQIIAINRNVFFDKEKADYLWDFNSSDPIATILKTGLAISDVFVENSPDDPTKIVVHGRPTDRALVMAGYNAGLTREGLDKILPSIIDLPFDSRQKFSASLRRENDKYAILYVVGAPEEIIKRILYINNNGRQKSLPSKDFDNAVSAGNESAEKGSRILACAYRRYELSKTKNKPMSELIKDLTFTGFIALKDCIRKEAEEALKITKSAGIKTIIITGDQLGTAKAVSEGVGLVAKPEEIVEGKYLDTIDDDEMKILAGKALIYYRVSPAHKLKIVNALQANGEVTAMIGDGVNDATAIKAADIGVALGSGTDIAKEAADMVLVNDNYYTITKAVEWGRMIFENLRRTIIYFIADDFSEIFVSLATIFSGMPIPLIPVQILWIDLIENAFPGVALAFSNESYGVMNDKPRGLKEPIFNDSYKKWLICVFFVGGLSLFITFYFALRITGDVSLSRTIVFAQTMLDSICFMLIVSSLRRPLARKDLFANRYLIIAVFVSILMIVAAVYVPVLNRILSTVPLTPVYWIVTVAISLTEVVILELTKYWFLNRKRI